MIPFKIDRGGEFNPAAVHLSTIALHSQDRSSLLAAVHMYIMNHIRGYTRDLLSEMLLLIQSNKEGPQI